MEGSGRIGNERFRSTWRLNRATSGQISSTKTLDDDKQNFQINKENTTGRKRYCRCYRHQKKWGLWKRNANFLSCSFWAGRFVSFRHMYRSTSQMVTTVQCLVSLGSRTGGNCALSGRREFCRHTVGGTKRVSLSGVHQGVSSWTSPLGRQQKACSVDHWSVPGFLKGVLGWGAHYDTISVWCAPCSPRLRHIGCDGVSGTPWSYKIWETKTMNCLGKERETKKKNVTQHDGNKRFLLSPKQDFQQRWANPFEGLGPTVLFREESGHSKWCWRSHKTKRKLPVGIF